MSAVLEQVVEETPHPLSVTIPVPSGMVSGIRPVGAVVVAEAFEIDSAEMAQLAADQRTVWARQIDNMEQMQEGFMKPAKKFMADVKENCIKWFGVARLDLNTGREILGGKLLAWEKSEQDRVARERAEAEAQARKIRQEAEAKAAAERARAEEQAREASRKAREAEEAQRKALAKGNARAAAAAAAESAKQAEKAQAAIENGNAKAMEAQMQAAATVVAPVVQSVKIAGQSMKDNWVAVLEPGVTEDQAKLRIVEAIAAGRKDLLALVEISDAPRGPLNKLAGALKAAMSVPGYRAENRPTLAGARK